MPKDNIATDTELTEVRNASAVSAPRRHAVHKLQMAQQAYNTAYSLAQNTSLDSPEHLRAQKAWSALTVAAAQLDLIDAQNPNSEKKKTP